MKARFLRVFDAGRAPLLRVSIVVVAVMVVGLACERDQATGPTVSEYQARLNEARREAGMEVAPVADTSGPALYGTYCARCHEQTISRMPTRAALRERDPRDIYVAMSAGLMAPYAREMSNGERRAIAEYLSGQSLGAFASIAETIPKKAYCEGRVEGSRNVGGAWNGWGVDLSNTRFQSGDAAGLSRADIKKLKLKWAFGVPAVTTMSGQPTVVEGRLYFGTFSGLLLALDAKSGCVLWAYEAEAGIRTAIHFGRDADGVAVLYFGDLGGSVYAVDAMSGEPRWVTRPDDHPHLRITGSPVYYNGSVYVPLSSLEEVAGAMPDYECCTFRGGVVALDATNGALRWKTHTIAEAPSARGPNAAGTERYGPSGAAIWSAPTLDPEHNLLYVTTGDSYSDPPAPESDAVMAITMDRGEVRWIRQTTAGDAYTLACLEESEVGRIGCPESDGPDVDYGASPVLRDLPDGSRILLAGQKSGWLYGMDPTNGEIRWQTRLAQGGIVGGIEWGFAADEHAAYVALSDAWEKGAGEAGGIAAVRIADGVTEWEVPPVSGSCDGIERCNSGQLAAVSAMPGVAFSGSLDGHLRAYATETGDVLWDYDTRRDFKTVNGVEARGGSLNGPGATIADGMIYTVSGYGLWNLWMPGNVLLAFSVDGD